MTTLTRSIMEFSSKFFFETLERIINDALKYDPSTRKKLIHLENKQLELHCSEPKITLFVFISNQHIFVSDTPKQTSDVTLDGKVTELILLLLNGEQSITGSGVTVSGQIGVLQEFKDTFSQLEIDWEDAISSKLGPYFGHASANLILAKINHAKSVLKQTQQQLPELLTEELQLIPSEPELNQFYSQVDELQSDLHRTSAKIQLLKNKLLDTK